MDREKLVKSIVDGRDLENMAQWFTLENGKATLTLPHS